MTVNCVDCHSVGYVNTPTDCWACHEDDFRQVSDPNHVTNNFSQNCLECHSVEVWEPSTFDHAATAFQLEGAHVTVNCIDCHSTGYVNTPTDCWACHELDFQEVSDPNHVTNNFAQNCLECHSVSAWEPATFDHSATGFALTGAHVSQSCIDCHANGYSGTPTDCYFCHQPDYDNTTDPNHASAQFPQNCQDCHNTISWDQTTWDHDNQYFPIYSGNHQEEWETCGDCHVSPSNYRIFECIFCHEHNQTDTDEDHSEVNNYEYSSSACYECHPRGRAEDDR